MARDPAEDVLSKEQAEKALYPARGLPGGGQLEVRMEISANHPDPEIRAVARRVKMFNLESWHAEWLGVAQKNEELATGFAKENRKVTAHEFYLRAADFYRRALPGCYSYSVQPLLQAHDLLERAIERDGIRVELRSAQPGAHRLDRRPDIVP